MVQANNTLKEIRRKSLIIIVLVLVAGIFVANRDRFIPVNVSAAKSVTCPKDGKFHIVEAVICDPDGQPFLPKGINEFAGQTFDNFGGSPNIATSQIVGNYVDGWKFNMLRIVMCPTGPCQSHPFTAQLTNLDALVNAYTARKVVLMLEYHQLPLAGGVSQSDVNQAIPWYKEMATKYKDNPYVWLETFNEPVDGNDQIQNWAGFTGQIVDAVRSVNPDKVVVICSGNYGQDSTGSGSSFDTGGSHILSAGSQLAAKGNVMFDVHFYSRWMNINTTGVKAYFDALHNAGFAVLVGETWGDPNGADFMRGDQMATDQLYAAKPNGVGILPWSAGGAYPAVNGGSARDVNTNANLTHNGSLHWNWTHNPPSAVPDGYTVTTGGGASPTVPPVSPTGGTNNCPASKPKGDANCDGVPTLVDYQIWRNEFKKILTTTTADFNGDGNVTLVDYQIWRNGFKGGTAVSPTVTTGLSPTTNPNSPDTQLNISIDTAAQGAVTLENSVMKAVFKAFPLDDANPSAGYNFAITEWISKKTNRNIAKQANGQAQDKYNAEWCYGPGHTDIPKFHLTATIVSSTADSKSVRMQQDGCNSSEVWTIFAHSPVIKIQYENIPDHIMDDRNQRHNIQNGSTIVPEPHDLTVYMNGSWRDFQCDQMRTDFCEMEVFRNPSPLGNPSDPANGGALNYKNMEIFGYTEKATGFGFGRVMPFNNVTWFNNQLNMSHEHLLKNIPFTGYLFMVTGGGPQEVLSTGKAVADGTMPKM